MRRTAWMRARSLLLALLWCCCVAWTLPARAQQASSPDIPVPTSDLIDDVTTYSFSKIADFTPISLPVTRTFPRKIKKLKLTITGGSADDLGYVGGMLVTNAPGCGRGVGQVVTPVDVTSQVTVNDNTASFTLTAVETCCCYTGWGGATLHWEVELEPDCTELVCRSQCAPGPTDTVPSVSTSWSSDKKSVSCGPLGGEGSFGFKLKAAGSFDPAQCSGSGGGCTSKGKASGEAEVAFELCGNGLTLTGGFEYAQSTSYEQSCDMDACGMRCDPDRYCSEGGGQFTGKYEDSRDLETPRFLKYLLRSRGTKNFAWNVDCTLKEKQAVEVKIGAKRQENHGSSKPTCETCAGFVGEMSGEVGGSGSCKGDVTVAGLKVPVKCNDCAALKIGAGFKTALDSCGGGDGRDCGAGSVSGEGKLGFPPACASLYGMRVKYGVSGKVTAKCEADSCEGKPLTCDVKPSGSASFSIDFNTKC